jgi:hypothetical protein
MIKKDPADPEGTAGRTSEDTTTVDPSTESEVTELENESGESEAPQKEFPEASDESDEVEGEARTSSPKKSEGEKEEDVESVEVFFGDEEPSPEPPKDSAAWARLRKSEAEAKKKAAELQRKLETMAQPSGVPDPGPEPTLEDCDYDQDLLKKRVREHDEATRRKQAADTEAAEKMQARAREVQELVNNYSAKKAVFSKKVKGYEEAESTVIAMMSPERQDVLLKVTDNPEQLVYALGRRPDKLEELAKEMDRDRFVAKLKKLEVSVTMKKGTSTPPEERVSGSGSPGPAGSTLERLRAEAYKTGDYSKVNAWKRQQRERSRK